MAFERTQTKHRAPMPSPGEESVIHGETKTRQSKREGFVSGALKRIQRFRKERAAKKDAASAAKRKAEAERKKKEVTRKGTETKIKSRRERMQEELKDLGI